MRVFMILHIRKVFKHICMRMIVPKHLHGHIYI